MVENEEESCDTREGWQKCLSCHKNADLIDEADPETDKDLIETLQKQCVLSSGVKELLKELTVDKIESICKLSTLVFSNSVHWQPSWSGGECLLLPLREKLTTGAMETQTSSSLKPWMQSSSS